MNILARSQWPSSAVEYSLSLLLHTIMDLSTLKSFKSHAFNLSHVLSHSYFLQSCLHLGLTPNNFTLPIPFSATPPTLCHTLTTFQFIQSVHLTHTVLEHNTRAVQTHASSCILLLMKATVIWLKCSFLFRFISICLSDAHPRAG